MTFDAASGSPGLFVPGRLCLFGEHSHWAGAYRATHPEIAPGRCLVVGTEQGLCARAEPLADALDIESVLPGGTRVGPERIPLERLGAAARRDDFFRCAAGTLAELRARAPIAGLSLRVRASLPVRQGLSS